METSPGPPLAPQLPAHCSQSHRCGQNSRSPCHSGSWLRCTRLWRHSGTGWAHTHPRGAWQLGDRAGGVGRGWTTPISDLCPRPHPVHLPQVFPGSLSHLTHVTHRCPTQAQTLATILPTMSPSPRQPSNSSSHYPTPPPHPLTPLTPSLLLDNR